MQQNTDTEKEIIKAARKIFIQKGYAGARMQQIADEANINKALLHYYFRNKERLFETIFEEAFSSFWPPVLKTLETSKSFKDVLKGIISSYMDVLLERPDMPAFLLQEIHRDPEKLSFFTERVGNKLSKIKVIAEEEIKKGNLPAISVNEVLLNTLSLCIFPFAGMPLARAVIWNNDKEAYDMMLKKRKESVFEFICNALYKDHEED